jgi:hypothetical protein
VCCLLLADRRLRQNRKGIFTHKPRRAVEDEEKNIGVLLDEWVERQALSQEKQRESRVVQI